MTTTTAELLLDAARRTCPTCKAKSHQPCTEHGKAMIGLHILRIRDAIQHPPTEDT